MISQQISNRSVKRINVVYVKHVVYVLLVCLIFWPKQGFAFSWIKLKIICILAKHISEDKLRKWSKCCTIIILHQTNPNALRNPEEIKAVRKMGGWMEILIHHVAFAHFLLYSVEKEGRQHGRSLTADHRETTFSWHRWKVHPDRKYRNSNEPWAWVKLIVSSAPFCSIPFLWRLPV